MLERVFERAAGGDPEAATAVEGQLAQMIPLRRIGRPEEAAEAAGRTHEKSYLTDEAGIKQFQQHHLKL